MRNGHIPFLEIRDNGLHITVFDTRRVSGIISETSELGGMTILAYT